jgi:NhaP-type Na+/H+ or K+/H+ antiporter
VSPARSKRQAALPHKRDRADIVKAVAVAAAIVIVTALLVWLLRPGPPGVPATGGLMNRQPRASWLIGLAIGIAGIATWWILTRSRRRTRARAKVILPIVLGVVLVATVVGGFLWPGGLLRHDVAPPKPEPTPSTTTPTSGAPTTVAPSSVGQTTVAPTTVAPTTRPANASSSTSGP